MEKEWDQSEQSLPIPVLDYRFDQKNEMFKRSLWDEKMKPHGDRFYREVNYLENVGFRKIDYALKNAAWNLEWTAGFGNSRSNSGLYAWEGVNDRIKRYVETGDPVKEPPEEMSRIVKKVARYYGADLVGICRLHPNWIYSHEYNTATREHYPLELPEECHNVIVMAIQMDYETVRMSPSGPEGAAVGLGYSKMAFLTNLLATFIRGLGYRAIPSGNDTALSIPLALAAGLGEVGRLGLLITKKFGPRVRLCKVFTDLPLHYDSYQPFGVMEFCQVCKKCAINCPSQAITHGDKTTEGHNISNQPGILKWYVDCEKCFQWWAKIRMGCGNCIQICPFNKPSGFIHDLSRSMIRTKNSYLNRLLVWIDTLMRYDRRFPPERFWDDK
nr:reductive dehalogenase [uncultured prokaryote]